MFNLIPQSHYARSRDYGKAKDNEDIRHIIDLMDDIEDDIARAWLRYVSELKSNKVDADFENAYDRGDIEAILRITDKPFSVFSEILPKSFLRAGDAANLEFREEFGVQIVEDSQVLNKQDVDPSVDISFDPGNSEAAAYMRQARLDLIREILEEQKKAIRAALSRALSEGLGPVEASRLFKQSIGLTQHQNGLVSNFERKLRTLDPTSLSAALRDRRYDRTLQRAIDNQVRLTEKQISMMVDRYRTRFIAMRAETIARTESLRVVNAARHSSMTQLADKVGMEMSRIIRIWRSVNDMRTRHTHRLMNRQRRGAKEYFRSPSGAKLMYPGDRRASAAETINCRCVLTVKIKGPEGAPILPGQAPGRISPLRTAPTAPGVPQPFSVGGNQWVRGSNNLPNERGWSDGPIRSVADANNPLTVLKPDRGDAWDIKGVARKVRVSIDDLTTWQPGIDTGKLRPLVGEYPPIKLAQVNGELVIMDGNHRAVSAWLAGDKTIEAIFVNFDTKKTWKWFKPKFRPKVELPDHAGVSDFAAKPVATSPVNPYTTVADDIYRVSDDAFFSQSEYNMDFPVAEIARSLNITKKEVVELLNKKAAKLAGDAEIFIRIPDDPSILRKVADSGRIKSQFETGEAHTLLHIEERAKKEKRMLGIAKDAAPADRPIYGYLSSSADGIVGKDVDLFGKVAFKLKPYKRINTTVVGDDSAHVVYRPTPVNAPKVDSFEASKLYKANTIEEASDRYAEVQIGHGVDIANDVSEIIFMGDSTSALSMQKYNEVVSIFSNFNVPVRFVQYSEV